MDQFDEVVSGWLKGSDSVNGHNNPAGPLYTEGQATVEAALASSDMAVTLAACGTLAGGTTCSFGGGCLCC